MLFQILFLACAAGGAALAWNGVDRSDGWRMTLGALVAISFLIASCTQGPNMSKYDDCSTYGRFASDC